MRSEFSANQDMKVTEAQKLRDKNLKAIRDQQASKKTINLWPIGKAVIAVMTIVLFLGWVI